MWGTERAVENNFCENRKIVLLLTAILFLQGMSFRRLEMNGNARKVQYVCPVHDTEILFEKEVEDFKTNKPDLVTRINTNNIIPPVVCKLCQKGYYEWECKEK